MALSCKNGVCIAGKRLSRKKLNALIPKHDKFIEAFAGNAWVYRECLKTGNCSDNAVLNDINCKTTSTDQRPKFCKDFKCKIITTSGMYGRKLKDLVIKNY